MSIYIYIYNTGIKTQKVRKIMITVIFNTEPSDK